MRFGRYLYQDGQTAQVRRRILVSFFGRATPAVQTSFIKIETHASDQADSRPPSVHQWAPCSCFDSKGKGGAEQTSNGTDTDISKVTVAGGTGIFTPHTKSGTIVADGLLASCFTDNVYGQADGLLGKMLLASLAFAQHFSPSRSAAQALCQVYDDVVTLRAMVLA